MLFLRITNPSLKYAFDAKPRQVSLHFQANLMKPLDVVPGGAIQEHISVTIDSATREEPFEIGSILYEKALKDSPADIQIWAHASAADIESMYDRARIEKYAYMVFSTNLVFSYNEWDIERKGNPVAIHSYSFTASANPFAGELPDQGPQATPATSTQVSISSESKYAQWLFWLVLGIGVLLVLRLH